MSDLIWYDSTEAGAPVMNNVAGSMLDVLRACLVTGFGSKIVTNITVSAEVATVNCTAHGFAATYQKLVLIEGCTEVALNGNKQPLSVAADTLLYTATGVADGVYTGTITMKRAPLGWIEEFTGTDKSIFSRTDPAATANKLRVEDTRVAPASTIYAHVVMVESATDVDTYTNRVPTTDTVAAWSRGTNVATAQQWVIVGDSKRVFVSTANSGGVTYTGLHTYFFGDPEFLMPSDSFGCLLVTHNSLNMQASSTGFSDGLANTITDYTASAGAFLSRTYDGTTVQALVSWHALAASVGSAYPSAVSYPTILSGPYYVNDSTNNYIRSKLNIYQPSTYKPYAHLAIVQPDNSTNKFLIIEKSPGSTTVTNVTAFAIQLNNWV